MWDGRGDENLYKYYAIMVSNFENDEDEEDDNSWFFQNNNRQHFLQPLLILNQVVLLH